MLSAEDRQELERLLTSDPFAPAMPSLVRTLREDDLAATLFLHRAGSTSNCACGRMRLSESHTLHLAEMVRRCVSVDTWTRHLLHASQHDQMVIALAGRIQAIANEMRAAVGLPEFGWNDSVPDEEFQECSVHVQDCSGQHTHP